MFRYMDQVYAVYREGSFTKAAAQLCVSQPALSATVKKAEEALGYPIFDRSSKAVTLTDVGKQYIDAVERIMLIRENLHSQIDDLHNLRRGSFILGGTTLIISHVLPQVLKDFSKDYPDVDVRLQVEPSTVLWDKLAHGQVDIAIDNALVKDPDHEYIPLFREHILIGVPADNPINEKLKNYALDPALLEKPGCDYSLLPRLNIKLLANEDFILLKPGNKMRQIAHNIFTEQGISPKVRFEFDRLTTSINFAESGFGICFLTDTNLQYGTCKNLVFYQPDAWDADRHLYLMYKKNKYLSAAMKAFIDFLKKSF